MRDDLKLSKIGLRNCPFCYAAGSIQTGRNGSGHDICYVECTDCKARTYSFVASLYTCAIDEAKKAWNNRATNVHPAE